MSGRCVMIDGRWPIGLSVDRPYSATYRCPLTERISEAGCSGRVSRAWFLRGRDFEDGPALQAVFDICQLMDPVEQTRGLQRVQIFTGEIPGQAG